MTATVPPTPPPPPPDAIPGGVAASGRVELAHGYVPDDPRFANDDLLPVPVERRTYDVQLRGPVDRDGPQHPVLAARLRSGGARHGLEQAVFTIALANLIVLAPMLLTGHAGPKYGIPFPVLARASFGLRGADLPP
ncbi:Nitrate reductase OS=Streptomyces microflavus OX=1919 GN=Smic_68960 PE=3 SV=1 [Streptomyces microflavus]